MKSVSFFFFYALIITAILLITAVNESTGLRKDQPSAVIISSKQMDANNIRTWYRNNGSVNRNPTTGNSGFEWPKGSGKFARYASGLWIGAKVGDDTLIAIAEYDYEYLPGYIDAGGNPQGKDDSLYRIYVINKNETNTYDYIHWPYEQGAYRGSDGKPFLMGDQTMFYSYTDGYPEAHGNNAGSTAPLKAQILQTNWCYERSYGSLSGVIYTEMKIINRSSVAWENCYFSIWTDDDLGSAPDDAVGSDSVLSLGYTYNFSGIDDIYGAACPAVGFQIIRGPLQMSPGDTAKYFDPPGSDRLVVKPGCRISEMSSFNSYYSSDPVVGDPYNFRQTYNSLQGLRLNNTPWINPITGHPTKFPYNGDPESSTGWTEQAGGDRRTIHSCGPVTMNPGDTQSIITAQIIARGNNNRNSVSILKLISKSVRQYLNNNFSTEINVDKPRVTYGTSGNGKIVLYWNDTCEKISYPNKLSGGTYKFQGYNVYRILPNYSNPSSADTILLKTFDIADGIRDIRDSVYLENYQGIIYGIVQPGSDNGIARVLELEMDTVSRGAFINGSEYKFSVTAYYFDPTGGFYSLPKVLRSSLPDNIIKIVVQNNSPELSTEYKMGDTLFTDQRTMTVLPVIADPLRLLKSSYTSEIGGTIDIPTWTLLRESFGIIDTLLKNVPNFSYGHDTARIVDGMILHHFDYRDSGMIPDKGSVIQPGKSSYRNGWDYEPAQNLWFEGPDTTAVKTAKMITNRQYQSRSIGMSFPTNGTFRNSVSRVKANGKHFTPVSGQNAILTGGPLRKIKIVFGQPSKSYRYVPADTNLTNTPYADMVDVPFSVFAVDELDSTGGTPRQLNTAFLDKDNNSLWDPDTSLLGNYHFTYILASDYDPVPNQAYTGKNPGIGNPTIGFPAMDVMYAWHPRAKKTSGGSPMKFTEGDVLTVWPYRITKPEFVPGYPLRYTWEVKGISISSSNITSAEIASINVFPNPYFATSELEYDSGGEKFIYFSNLPLRSTIYIYTLDGVLVKKIIRDSSDPNSSLQKWDLKNSDGSYVASGMYIVYVDCGSAGAKTLKAAVFMSR
ncbi:MAG: hypothetical protein K1X85_01815 [Ignavibacteria bacterium]|nr:hypothetical protein [Ignavibacteria bacterium]